MGIDNRCKRRLRQPENGYERPQEPRRVSKSRLRRQGWRPTSTLAPLLLSSLVLCLTCSSKITTLAFSTLPCQPGGRAEGLTSANIVLPLGGRLAPHQGYLALPWRLTRSSVAVNAIEGDQGGYRGRIDGSTCGDDKHPSLTRPKSHDARPVGMMDEMFEQITGLGNRIIPALAIGLLSTVGPLMMMARPVGAENELAQYAKEGNKVGVDAKCFVERCTLPTQKCLNNPDCLKGISCLSKCKGEGTCSTACFAKYGNEVLDNFLHCAVEKQDCVHVPRDRSRATWSDPDAAGSSKKPSADFQIASLKGRWYKVMGMDARYDCFDCQVNHFTPKEGKPDVMVADVKFRMPRPRAPGFWENHITEELLGDGPGARRSMHSVGRMFGLTFWENWYVIGETNEVEETSGLPPYKFVYYTGHTLQGNYEGAFVYSRTPELPQELMPAISKVARENGLDPSKFCKIRNTCFMRDLSPEPLGFNVASAANPAITPTASDPISTKSPIGGAGGGGWGYKARTRMMWLPQKIVQLTTFVNQEWNDWFEDPIQTSDWLIRQQERVQLVAEPPIEIEEGLTRQQLATEPIEQGVITSPTTQPPSASPALVDYLANSPKNGGGF